MVRLFNEVLHWGARADEDSTTQRKVLMCNVGALTGVFTLLLFDAIFLYSSSVSARLAALSHIPFYLCFVSVLWLNRHDHHDVAGVLLLLSAMAANLGPMLLAFGAYFHHHHYFILFAVAPISIISSRRWLLVAAAFVVNSALFIGFSLREMAPAPDILSIDDSVVTTFRTLLSFLVILTMGIFYWAYDIFAERSERELQSLSMTDSLTQLPNRRYFESAFQQEVAKARRSSMPVSLAFMDIDHFKSINDTYGHNVGDAVIRHIAQVVQGNLRAGSIVARLGGDELVVLMPGSGIDEACRVMERVHAAVAVATCECEGSNLRATVSIGVALVDINAPLNEAYRHADGKLYAAKQAGRNVVKC